MHKKLSGVRIMAFTTIDDPSAYFHTQLYNGNGSSQSITNDANAGDFQPDWLWSKSRNDGFDNITRDSSRGNEKRLLTHSTAAEGGATGTTSFDSDGFSLDSTNTTNKSSDNYVAWQWKANGGTTTTNDASSTSVGTIDSVYQANTDAGFSIILYTGDGNDNASFAHGLGAIPHFHIIKRRNDTEDWLVYHHENTSNPNTDHLLLNTTDATSDSDTRYSDAGPSATTITMGNNAVINADGSTYVCYAFTEKQGYSRFGNFIGNGTTDGGFVYTGFKPAWLMIKETVSGGGWGIWDNKRMSFNTQSVNRLLANSSNAEDASNDNRIDFLSNGFKVRTSSGSFNQDATTILYIAFAENPFVSSEGVPTTAR